MIKNLKFVLRYWTSNECAIQNFFKTRKQRFHTHVAQLKEIFIGSTININAILIFAPVILKINRQKVFAEFPILPPSQQPLKLLIGSLIISPLAFFYFSLLERASFLPLLSWHGLARTFITVFQADCIAVALSPSQSSDLASLYRDDCQQLFQLYASDSLLHRSRLQKSQFLDSL